MRAQACCVFMVVPAGPAIEGKRSGGCIPTTNGVQGPGGRIAWVLGRMQGVLTRPTGTLRFATPAAKAGRAGVA